MNFQSMSDAELLETISPEIVSSTNLAELFGYCPHYQTEIDGVSDQIGEYVIHPKIAAIRELMKRVLSSSINLGLKLDSAKAVKELLIHHLGGKEREHFVCLWLDNHHNLIKMDVPFKGTLTTCTVHIREIAKDALKYNAAAVIFGHSHPSSCSEPSDTDVKLTKQIREALNFFDVRVIDHIVVGGNKACSMAEKGLI